MSLEIAHHLSLTGIDPGLLYDTGVEAPVRDASARDAAS